VPESTFLNALFLSSIKYVNRYNARN